MRKETQKAFANYLRENLKTPSDWNDSLFGAFPGKTAAFQKYFGYVLEKNINIKKVEAIENEYNLHKYENIDKKVEIIDGKPRSIEKFFKEKTTPRENKLKFIALVFESPILTIEDFVESQKEENNNKSIEKEVILKKDKPDEKSNKTENIEFSKKKYKNSFLYKQKKHIALIST